MIHYMFAILDLKAGMYSPPYLAPSRGSGIRMFGDAVTAPESAMAKHPEDYELYEVGMYDDGDASLVGAKPCVLSGRAVDYVMKGGAHAPISSQSGEQAAVQPQVPKAGFPH